MARRGGGFDEEILVFILLFRGGIGIFPIVGREMRILIIKKSERKRELKRNGNESRLNMYKKNLSS